MKTTTLHGLLVLLAISGPALAETASPDELADLKARVTELERQVDEMSPAADSHAGHFMGSGLPLHGFISVGASESSTNDPQRLRGFELNNIDFYLTPSAGDHVHGLVEINFEIGEDGAVSTDLERMQLGYTAGDNTLWFGRFHVPYGYWNTAHHHGAALQTSINRPRFLDFEDKGGILPAHAVGVWLTGRHAVGDAAIGYNAWLANGGRIQTTAGNDNVLDFNQFTDSDQHKMLGFSAAWMSAGDFDGFQVGLHGYADRVTTYAPDNTSVLDQTDVRMAGAFVYYGSDKWEVNGEYYHFDDDVVVAAGPAMTGSHSSNAGFFQVGYSVAAFTPFLRAESVSLDSGDAYFSSMSSGVPYTRQSAGVKYQLNPQAVLKLEVGHTHDRLATLLDTSGVTPGTRSFAPVSYNRVQVQAAVAF